MARIVSPILCVLCVLCGKEVGFPSRTFALNALATGNRRAGYFAAHSTRLFRFSVANELAFLFLEPVLELYAIFTSLVLRFQSADPSPDGHNVGVFDAPKMKPGTKCPRLFFQHHR